MIFLKIKSTNLQSGSSIRREKRIIKPNKNERGGKKKTDTMEIKFTSKYCELLYVNKLENLERNLHISRKHTAYQILEPRKTDDLKKIITKSEIKIVNKSSGTEMALLGNSYRVHKELTHIFLNLF